MASIPLDSFDVAVAELELERCAEMPQAMKDDRWKLDFLNKGIQFICDLASFIRASGFLSNDKAVVSIGLSTKFLYLRLCGFHICQCLADSWSQIDAAFNCFLFWVLLGQDRWYRAFSSTLEILT